MNEQGHYRQTELNASALESFGGQKTSNETFAKARELRRFIAKNPNCTSLEMPEALRGFCSFLQQRRLAYWKRREDGKAGWFVKPI